MKNGRYRVAHAESRRPRKRPSDAYSERQQTRSVAIGLQEYALDVCRAKGCFFCHAQVKHRSMTPGHLSHSPHGILPSPRGSGHSGDLRRSRSPVSDRRQTPDRPSKRFQVPRACDRCKSLRRGCSEYRPCKRCIDSGVGDQCRGPGSLQGVSSPTQVTSSEASISKLMTLASPMIIDYCTARFFERLHPTIPILTPEYVAELRIAEGPAERDLEAVCVLCAMCAQVLLQADEPENLHRQGIIPDSNSDFARRLLTAVMETHQTLPRTVSPSLELCLLTFFIYACQARLFHHGQAFLFLREATTLLLLFRRETERDQRVRELADRLFWVLLISERSHAIRYRRPITLHITSETPQIDTSDPSLVGFWSLASLFRPIDTSFVSLLNRETFAIAPARESLAYVELVVNAALRPTMELHDTQKANLRVTQLWLRIIIWQLRLHLGYLTEESQQASLTYQYPVEVAKDLMLSTRDLPLDSIKVHGVGITEKIYDVASAVVDVLARIPLAASSPDEPTSGSLPEDALVYLKQLISRLPGGEMVYVELLEKHTSQAIPSMGVHQSPTG